ncbi:MAG: tRNA pseudouridine(55) synthase TruB [Bacilli bacterium]|nr:tRNA pseudouridine(55) synthase TruB [Bacilli bacterium]
MNGVLLVNKEQGLTSQDVVSRVKRILNIKKAGHAGTLDPLATGVVVVLLGEATKISNYLLEESKEYQAEVVIGVATDTEDATGTILATKNVNTVDSVDVDRIIQGLIGKQLQIPPMYSAIKLEGKKLYELARKGITIKREPREIEVFDIKRTNDIEVVDGKGKFSFVTRVSKGTYIRTLCTEIGNRLEYPAHMSKLERISSGNFHISSSYTLKEISDGKYKILSALDALKGRMIVEIDDNEYSRVKNGMILGNKEKYQNNGLIILSYHGELVGIYKKTEEHYKAERVWN